MLNNNLPHNWSWVKLGDVGEVVAGGTPSTKVPEYFDGEIAWITPADLTGYKNKYISRGRRNISEEGLKNSSARLIPKGSILFSSRAPIGYVAIASNDVSTNQGFKNLVITNKVNSEFVYYYLKFAKQLAEKNASGTTFKEISSTNFAKLPIPLPPLPVQKKIVEKLEELFSQLDSGVASIKQAKVQIRLYRQSILAAAFSGRLTGELGKKEMLKAAEPKTPYSNQLPDGWNWVKLGEVCTKVTDGSHTPPSKKNQGLPMLSARNIYNGSIIFEGYRLIDENEFEKENQRTRITEGDVLLTIVGTIGRSAVVKKGLPRFTLQRSVAVLSSSLNSNYLSYFFQLTNTQKWLMDKAKGTAQKGIYLNTLKNLPIISAPTSSQISMVEEIKKRFSEADNLEKAIDESLAKSETLRQSILKRAFEGKLV